MRMLPTGKRMTKASDASSPCAMRAFCRLLIHDCDGPPCPPRPLPNASLLSSLPPLLFDPPPYHPPGPYCAATVVAATRHVSYCGQFYVLRSNYLKPAELL